VRLSNPNTPPDPLSSFDLLETMRWTPEGGFYLLERHLHRLLDSARYFGITCSLSLVREVLARAVGSPDHSLRVRQLVGADGNARAETSRLEPAAGTLRIGLAARPIDPTDPFLFHKTTNRTHLERERSPAHDEVVLWNPDGAITEAMTANIVIHLDGRAVTPPVECGLLPGTMRAELLEAGEIAEARVTVEQLLAARRVWLVNSVRGWREGLVVR
jgi:branched-subunit amino acid aminotransferase/4-amino-4-deoxychorismate lyase